MNVKMFFSAESVKNTIKNTMILRYGVDNPAKMENHKDKVHKTCQSKWGVNCYSQTEEWLKRYKLTSLSKFGKEFYTQTEEYKIRYMNTCFQKYGIYHIFENKDLMMKCRLNKHQNLNSYNRKSYILPSGKEVKIQRYEDRAINCLLKYFNEDDLIINDIDIENYIGTFHYSNGIRIRRYFPDIYVIPTNEIVEVKSSYTYNCELINNLLKRKSVLDRNINFSFMIMDSYKIS